MDRSPACSDREFEFVVVLHKTRIICLYEYTSLSSPILLVHPMSNDLRVYNNSLATVVQEIRSLAVQLEEGVHLSGEPTRSSDSFKDTLDKCTRLLTQGMRVLCIADGEIGRSCLVNHVVQARMQSGQATKAKVLSEVYLTPIYIYMFTCSILILFLLFLLLLLSCFRFLFLCILLFYSSSSFLYCFIPLLLFFIVDC